MSLKRVLLLEDDASVRRFVTMALDDADIELVHCDSVAAVLSALASGAVFSLAVTDLSLADGSALPLVEWLALSQRCRVAVFSAGVTPDVRGRLEKAGVWRILEKPVALAQLRTCVAEGVNDRALKSEVSRQAETARSGDATASFFGGKAELYAEFERSCRHQFLEDVRLGDEASEQKDMAELRRLAHSLKTVLTLLGYEQHAATARLLDRSAASGRVEEALRWWHMLRPILLAEAV
ncbi:response regulator [uncultured Xylophilus sp.]|uniref:response regulator n=1 Tax=uncultured Xylophilus sp. TaxID=296832 RepID=UPI0025F032FE|nr:response regulator [uncultured Xylophilus sp.]